jgi:hypothetical protein
MAHAYDIIDHAYDVVVVGPAARGCARRSA